MTCIRRLYNKLEQWPTFSFTDFLKEPGNQKIKLSLAKQEEWIPYFEEQKNKAAALQNTINKTDAAIDQMVYQLYELTAEEIAIVKKSFELRAVSKTFKPSNFFSWKYMPVIVRSRNGRTYTSK